MRACLCAKQCHQNPKKINIITITLKKIKIIVHNQIKHTKQCSAKLNR